MDERLTELEVRLTYQERLISDLDDVVRAFTARVEALEKTIAELRESVVNGPAPIGEQNDPPPHY